MANEYSEAVYLESIAIRDGNLFKVITAERKHIRHPIFAIVIVSFQETTHARFSRWW